MIIVASIEAVALVLVVWILIRHMRMLDESWVLERRELINRVQFPHAMPVTPSEPFTVPEPEPDDLHLVGSILNLEEE